MRSWGKLPSHNINDDEKYDIHNNILNRNNERHISSILVDVHKVSVYFEIFIKQFHVGVGPKWLSLLPLC